MTTKLAGTNSPRIFLIHGENVVLSRKELVSRISLAKENGATIVRLDGSTLQLKDLQDQLGSVSLFGDERVCVIEKLWSQKSPTRKTAIIKEICRWSAPCILWHDKTISAAQLKPFITAGAEIVTFKSSPLVFKTMELFGIQDKKKLLTSVQQSIQSDSAEFVFIMCIRQIRMLLLAKCGQPIAGAPFVAAKARSQAQRFTLEKLLDLHHQLVIMDRQLKTSTAVFDLEQFLTVWAMKTVA